MNGEEIKKIRKKINISQDALAKLIGVSLRTIQNWEAGGTVPKTRHEMLRKISEEEVFPTSKPSRSEVYQVADDSYVMVEYADLRASAGTLGGCDVQVLPEIKKRLVPKEFDNGNYLVVGVDGNSMNDGTARSLVDGDEVLIRELTDGFSELPIRKSLFVITTREGNVLKQIAEVNKDEEYIICHSFNSSYEDFKINFNEICQIFTVCKITQKKISLV